MQRALVPWVTAGVALAGATVITVTPVAPPLPSAQHRAFQLTSYDEFDLSQLMTTTQGNLTGLESVLSSSHWLSDPDISQGLSTFATDLSTNTANPATNPIALMIEGTLASLSSGYGFNAASTAATGVSDNIQAALSSGDYSAALTDLENAPTTILYGLLNGYPQVIGSELLSPQLGLLTNTANGASSGTIDAWQQVSNTLADEFSAIGGGNLTTTPDLAGPGTLDLSVNVGTVLNALGANGSITLPFSLDDLLNKVAAGGDITVPVSPDQVLSDLADSNGNITLPITPDQLVNTVADSNGNIALPITPDQLIGDFANSNGDIALPITYDQVLSDIAGSGGSINVPPLSISLDSVLQDFGINPGKCVGFSFVCISIDDVLKTLIHNTNPTAHISVPSLSVSTVANDLQSVLNAAGVGHQDISIPASTLESIFNGTGNQDITIPASTLDQIFGNTAGNQDISIPAQTIENFLGSAGQHDLSVPVTSLESLLGNTGSTGITLSISQLESILPGSLNLDLPIPEVTGSAVPAYDLALSQDLLAVLGSIAPVSSDLPGLLTADPTLDVVPLLSSLLTDLGLPIAITGGTLPADLTGIGAELLAGLVP